MLTECRTTLRLSGHGSLRLLSPRQFQSSCPLLRSHILQYQLSWWKRIRYIEGVDHVYIGKLILEVSEDQPRGGVPGRWATRRGPHSDATWGKERMGGKVRAMSSQRSIKWPILTKKKKKLGYPGAPKNEKRFFPSSSLAVNRNWMNKKNLERGLTFLQFERTSVEWSGIYFSLFFQAFREVFFAVFETFLRFRRAERGSAEILLTQVCWGHSNSDNLNLGLSFDALSRWASFFYQLEYQKLTKTGKDSFGKTLFESGLVSEFFSSSRWPSINTNLISEIWYFQT